MKNFLKMSVSAVILALLFFLMSGVVVAQEKSDEDKKMTLLCEEFGEKESKGGLNCEPPVSNEDGIVFFEWGCNACSREGVLAIKEVFPQLVIPDCDKFNLTSAFAVYQRQGDGSKKLLQVQIRYEDHMSGAPSNKIIYKASEEKPGSHHFQMVQDQHRGERIEGKFPKGVGIRESTFYDVRPIEEHLVISVSVPGGDTKELLLMHHAVNVSLDELLQCLSFPGISDDS